MDTTDKTDKIENKSNESAQQGAETIEELINRKVEELLQTKLAKALALTKERVLQDWKEQEKTLEKLRIISGKNDEEIVKIVSDYLVSKYSNRIGSRKKYLNYTLELLQQASKRRLENSIDNYLVPGLGIMRRQKIELYSTPNVGKTFLSLEMAYKMAIGGWVFNTPEYAVPRPFKVLYVDNENRDILIDRLDRMTMYNRDLANDNMRFIRNGGVFTEDGTEDYLPVERFGKIDENAESLSDPIIAITRATGFIPDVIFIDPLVNVMLGDENQTKDMESFIGDIDRLIKYLGATVIINHHTKKESKGRDAYDARGSSVLAGALDMAVELRTEQKDKEEDEFELPLNTEKKLETEKKEDKNKTKNRKNKENDDVKISELSFHMTKNRTGPKLKSFYLGIFDTPIDELAFKPPVDNAKIESGLLVGKIYKDKPQGDLPTGIALHMSEMATLLHKKGLDPAAISTIQEEEYKEKIYNVFRTVGSYRNHMDSVELARRRLFNLVSKYPINKGDNNKSKEGKTSKPIDPFV